MDIEGVLGISRRVTFGGICQAANSSSDFDGSDFDYVTGLLV